MAIRLLPAVVTLMFGVALAGCGAGTSQGEQQGTASAGYEPVTIENCGIEQTFERPPERAVTMNQHVTEIMLALGLEQRMVGTAYLDDEILPEFREEYESVPVLAEEYPSREVLLGAEPDFVFGGFSSVFESDAAGNRKGLHELGIDTYLMTEYCPKSGERSSLEQVYEDIRNVGSIFGVEERAEKLVGEMQKTIRETQEAVEGVEQPRRVAYSEGGESAPFVAGGQGMAHEVIQLAGAENVYADLDDQFAESSFEEFVRRDPDVIVLGGCCGDTPEDVKRQLLSNPALSEVQAIREERFVEMGLSNLVAGVRSAETVRYLAEQLYSQQFEGDEYEPLYPGQFEGN